MDEHMLRPTKKSLDRGDGIVPGFACAVGRDGRCVVHALGPDLGLDNLVSACLRFRCPGFVQAEVEMDMLQ